MMRNPPFEQFCQSIQYPEHEFKMYLCPRDFEPLGFESFNGFEVPSVFCEALVYFLFKVEKKSGFARLQISTEIKKGKKRLVHWESGTSEQTYLSERDWERLEEFVEAYFRNQVVKHGLAL